MRITLGFAAAHKNAVPEGGGPGRRGAERSGKKYLFVNIADNI